VRVPTATRDGGEGGAQRRDGRSAQGPRWRSWRAARDHGEALGGAVVDQERLWWSAHGEQSLPETTNKRRWWIRSSV
jgi:hypothetical protein